MGNELGLEGLLGTSDDDGSPGLRDRLALATRYLANWYRATEGSVAKTLDGINPDTVIWRQKIDVVRRKVEDTYNELLQPLNQGFLSRQAKADYDDASASWAQLWRELQLSLDTVDASLVDVAASAGETLFTAPGLIVPQIGNELGKLIGGTLGNFLAQTWPYLAGAGVLVGVYIFRVPLARLAAKAV